MLLLLAGLARACDPYGSDKLVNDLQTLQLALRNLDESMLSTAAQRVNDGLPCLTTAVPPAVFASVYRYLGTWKTLAGDNEQARRYFRSALELEPTYAWDANELDMDSPIRTIFEEERVHAEDEPQGQSTAVLVSGAVYTLDGRTLTRPLATVDRPHLLLKMDSSKKVLGAWVMDGNTFPKEVLGTATAGGTKSTAKTTKATTKAVSTTSSTGAVAVTRKRPPEKIPLIIAGALGVAAAGGLYGYSFVTHAEFEEATTLEELEAKQQLTNALILGSGGALLVGLGVGYWGIAVDGGGVVGISGHF